MQPIFTPDRPFDETCQRAVQDLEAYSRACQGEEERVWKLWAGDRLEAMMNNPRLTNTSLEHPETTLRLTGAALVAEYWPPNQLFAASCLRLAFSDPDAAVRGAALTGLLYKLHPDVRDPTGLLGKLLKFLRQLDPIPTEVILKAQNEAERYQRLAHALGMKYCEQSAGPLLPEMLKSRAGAEAFLDHPDSDLRRAALLVISTHWKPTPEFSDACVRLILDDPDVGVRTQAIGALAAMHAGSEDPVIGELLARIVTGHSQPLELRRRAYAALFSIRLMPVSRWLEATSDEFRFPEDVDWCFVNTWTSPASELEQ